MKPNHLDHLPKMVNKFEQERGHELGVNKTWKKKGTHLQMVQMLTRTSTSKVGKKAHKITKSITLTKKKLKVFTNVIGCEKS